LSAAPAWADETITAGPLPNQFANPDVEIDQGELVTFRNSDSTGAFHDVTSNGKDSDGKALFASETIEGGKSAPVKGVEFLTTGDYGYICSVHPFMTGTLRVNSNGAPKPRTPDNPAPNPADTTPPTAGISILDSRISAVLKRGAVRLRLTTDEPARFQVAVKSGRTTVATGVVVVKGTARTLNARLTKAGKKALAKARRVTLKATARVNDAAGNRSAASATRKLRR
jgi:plastocyanin